MKINNDFEVGDMVYKVTDQLQSPQLIIGILINPNGIVYQLQDNAFYFEIELSQEKNLMI